MEDPNTRWIARKAIPRLCRRLEEAQLSFLLAESRMVTVELVIFRSDRKSRLAR